MQHLRIGWRVIDRRNRFARAFPVNVTLHSQRVPPIFFPVDTKTALLRPPRIVVVMVRMILRAAVVPFPVYAVRKRPAGVVSAVAHASEAALKSRRRAIGENPLRLFAVLRDDVDHAVY